MAKYTYPGVYVEEIPSGVRTITGVATSITAFIGRALWGPVDEPTMIHSYADYERRFGGLWVKSTMSYAVRDCYANGGKQAIIVRIHSGAGSATISLPTGGSSTETLILTAANVGAWGGKLKASVNYKTKYEGMSPPDVNLFNLIIVEGEAGEGGRTEEHINVSLNADDPRYLPRVLEQASQLVRVTKDSTGSWVLPGARPAETIVESGSPPSSQDNPVSASGGSDGADPGPTEFIGSSGNKTGIYALEKADLFNLLCIPPATRDGDTDVSVFQKGLEYCVSRRAMLVVDPPAAWGASAATAAQNAVAGLSTLNLTGTNARNAALYFPRVREADQNLDGVWKAPAGLDASLNGIRALQVNLTDDENGQLNQLGINCLRVFPVTGRVVWGARTLRGADQLADEYKYVPVRRTALFIEESLYRGTQWVVFEPNDEPLWAQIRLNVGAFMHNLFRQGAFQGTTPKEAYFVKCDKETTTQNDIDLGIVNILVGFAPLKPAEFVVIKIQQIAGQIEV
jgi:phage tail sheath protein FI